MAPAVRAACPMAEAAPSGGCRVSGRARAIGINVRLQKLTVNGHLFAAYELTLRALNLVDRDDPLSAMIADKIIEIGATGLDDPIEISKRTVKFLTFN